MADRFRSYCCTGLMLLASLVCNVPFAGAADFDADKLAEVRKRMQAFVDNKQVAGLVYVVGNSTDVAACEAIGLQDIGANKPMEKDSLFRIASMTKPLTAVGIMILQEEGKLSVDDPVEKHLPEFKGQMLVAEKSADRIVLTRPKRPITIRDLLTHTSGVANFPEGLSDIYSKRNHTLAEMTLAISQLPLQFEPGSKWSYCNPGIDTLGRIIEVESGRSYADFMAERIFKPLGMKDTTFYPTSEQLERSATLYGVKDGELVDAGFQLLGHSEPAKHPIPAGGLYSTGADLAKAYQTMLRGGKLGEARIISEDSVKQMTALQTGDIECGFTPGMGFGFGWAYTKQPQGVHAMMSKGTYGHGGAFGTQGWIDPEKDIFLVLLFQRTGLPNGDASDLRRELQSAVVEAIK
jgi:CubicO group peptidase (beta-lactamase class C family)